MMKIPLSTNGGILAVDVSRCQAQPNWKQALTNDPPVKAAWVKLSQGTRIVCKKDCVKRAKRAVLAGLPAGGYHFSEPAIRTGDAESISGYKMGKTGIEEATHFLKQKANAFGSEVSSLPDMLDIEGDYRIQRIQYEFGTSRNREARRKGARYLVDWINDWMDTVYERTDKVPLLYTSYRILHDYEFCLADDSSWKEWPGIVSKRHPELGPWPLWVASYDKSSASGLHYDGTETEIPRIAKSSSRLYQPGWDWSIWQFGVAKKKYNPVAGFTTDVDVNVIKPDYAAVLGI